MRFRPFSGAVLSVPAALLSIALLLALGMGRPPSAQGAGTILQVTTASDEDNPGNGVCSLREAITAANNNSYAEDSCNASGSTGTDSIRFNIGSETPVIIISSPLPSITDAVLIRGNTGGATRVELRGSGGPATGLDIRAGNVTVRNMVINGFVNGIQTFGNSPNITILGSFIGTDATGQVAIPNARGIYVQTPEVHIGGTTSVTPGGSCTGDCNVISGNTIAGIAYPDVWVTSTGYIKGNFIGTDVDGADAIPNSYGILMSDAGYGPFAIGGTEAGAGNLISGNTA
ncbi:MAG TPA: CSLREA domain-containing protein, partial [Dehalococcoidia bacterium]|nr:CSLREA domain-containing protein [Dehalococcoidia bacterium]